MRAHLDTLKQLTEAQGRDFSALTISYKAPLYDTGIPLSDGSRRPFSGAPEQIAADIRTFAGIGVHELIFDFRGRSIAESIERLIEARLIGVLDAAHAREHSLDRSFYC